MVLTMHAGQQRVAPAVVQFVGQPTHRVGPVQGAMVQDELARRVRASRDQIHHASERGRTVKSRRRALDHLDTRQIHGRYLEWSQGTGLSAVEGHAVGENLRVSAP